MNPRTRQATNAAERAAFAGGRTPDDDGETLVELARGEREQLRLSRRTYNGRAYLDLRVYELGRGGDWLPTRKGCSVRFSEAGDISAALDRALTGESKRSQGST